MKKFFHQQSVQPLPSRSIDWETVFRMPSRKEIADYQRHTQRRAPYIAGWLTIPSHTRYTEYTIDFRAPHLPRGTYCCLGNWKMDYSGLEKENKALHLEFDQTHAYAGLQNLHTGQTVSIMSFWDVFCQDAFGKKTTIRAKRLYPPTVIGPDHFWGEGTGARCIAPFHWEANHWYQMQLKCIPTPGTTLVEQWIYDRETGTCSLLCRYDTYCADSAFMGSIAIFLENFTPETAGEVRSLEVCNARYRHADTGKWQTINSVYLSPQGGIPQYEGSYNFGVSGNRIWMITSGVGGDWFNDGRGKRGTTFTIAKE